MLDAAVHKVHVVSWFDGAKFTNCESRRTSAVRPCVLLAVGVFTAYVAVSASQGILDLPPYEDQAVGLWAEATYLVENNFDYRRLVSEEPHFLEGVGGRRSYVISLQPTLVAVFLKATASPRATAIAFRLHSYAWATATVVSLYILLRPHLGRRLALFPCLLVVVTPLFYVQTEIGGMDIPLTGAAMLTLVALSRRRFAWAIALSALAFAMKATGAILSFAVLLYLISLVVLDGGRRKQQSRWRGLWVCMCLVLVVGEWSLAHWAALAQLEGASLGLQKVLMLLLVWWLCPDVAVVGLLAVAGAGLAVGHSLWGRSRDRKSGARSFDVLRRWLLQWPEVAVAWLTLGGLLLGIMQMMLTPRYCTLAVPTLYFLLDHYYLVTPRRHLIGITLLGLLLVFDVSNLSGRWLPSTEFLAEKTGIYARSCAWLERSLEYRPAHQSDVAVARQLDEDHSGAVIVSQFPHSYYLRWPALGYVSRPLDVRDLGSDLLRAHEQFLSIAEEVKRSFPPPELLLLSVEQRAMNIPWPPPKADFVYLDDCTERLAVYRLPAAYFEPGGNLSDWYTEGMLREITDPYLKIVFLAKLGNSKRSIALIDELLDRNPQDERARQLRSQLLPP